MAKGHYAEAQLVGQVLNLGQFHDGDNDHQSRFSFQVGTETDLQTVNGDPLGLKYTSWITLFGDRAEEAVDRLKEGDRLRVLARMQNSLVDGDFRLNLIIDDQDGEFEVLNPEEIGEYPPRQSRKQQDSGRGGRSRGSSSGTSTGSKQQDSGRGGRSRGSSSGTSTGSESKGGRSDNRGGGRSRRVAD